MITKRFEFDERQRCIILPSGNDIILVSNWKNSEFKLQDIVDTLSGQNKYLDAQDIYYSSGALNEARKKVLKYVEEWECKALKLYSSSNPFIISCLIQIRFTHLKDLNISTNDVVSLENLCRIFMPNMEFLWLWINPIQSCRSLVRGNWPELQTLDLKKTEILQLDRLSELHAPLLKRFDFNNPKNSASINGLFKFESKHFFNLAIKDVTKNYLAKIEKLKNHKSLKQT